MQRDFERVLTAWKAQPGPLFFYEFTDAVPRLDKLPQTPDIP
jgi:hypothetical protein